jgi:hypothetical protein
LPTVERNLELEKELQAECASLVFGGSDLSSKSGKRIKLLTMFSYLNQYARAIGINFIIYDFHRTAKQQQERYAKGRTEPGSIITYANGTTKKSRHQFWQAFDLLILDDNMKSLWKSDSYKILGDFWQALGGVWGGQWYIDKKTSFNDLYHFQL